MADGLFREYVVQNMKGKIIQEAQNFTENNYKAICKKCRIRKTAKKITPIEYKVKKEHIKICKINAAGEIAYRVLIYADLNIQFDNDEIIQQSVTLWAKCRSDITLAADHIIIDKISTIFLLEEGNLSDNLIPFIDPGKQDEIAKIILMQYYPEALEDGKVDVNVFAKRLGLNVFFSGIKKEFSVYGQIYFERTESTLYYLDKHEDKTYCVEPKSIIIDSRVDEYMGEKSTNSTIMHECVHWILHRNAMKLLKYIQISCGVKEMDDNARKMEYHANVLVPKILMPAEIFKKKADELMEKYKREKATQHIVFVMEEVIQELSKWFNVSKSSVRLRLFEMGYNEVLGVMNYVDGRYVEPHCTSNNSMVKNKTFCISAASVAHEMAYSTRFNEMLRENAYVYVDSHFCKDNNKYVHIDLNGNVKLTEYARTHMEECCIEFNVKYKSGFNGDNLPFEYTLNKKKKDSETIVTVDVNESANIKDYMEILEIANGMPNSFGEAYKYVLKKYGVAQDKIAPLIGMNKGTLSRMINNDGYNIQLINIINTCIVLKLPPDISFMLLERAGFKLRNSLEHTMYRSILYDMNTNDSVSDIKEDIQKMIFLTGEK